jgi:hypothetical protein
MAKLWDDFTRWVDDASKVVSKEAGDLTQKGKLKIEIFDLKWRLKDEYAEFGKTAYELMVVKKKENWTADNRIKSMIAKIKNTLKNLKVKEADYKKVGK